MVNFTYEIDPDGAFARAVKKGIEQVEDLTIPFTFITQSWYQSNKAIFSLKGPGQYPPLGGLHPNEKYRQDQTRRQHAEAVKERKYGFAYPLLKATGALERSLVDAGNQHAIHWILNSGKELVLGTNLEYAVYHQAPGEREKLPFRPMLFTGAEQTAPPGIKNQRQAAWIAIVEKYVNDVLQDTVAS